MPSGSRRAAYVFVRIAIQAKFFCPALKLSIGSFFFSCTRIRFANFTSASSGFVGMS